jgi:dienelactone hydrolase
MIQPHASLTPDLLPGWYTDMVRDLTFPLGWKPGHTDVAAWSQTGRRALEELLLQGPAPDPTPEVLATEDRDGYRVTHLTLALGPHRRTGAYLAVPDGRGPFPAVVLLHDHGARFTIGKEKMIRPLAGHPKADEAQAWADKYYGGRFVGDEAARRGWIVLSIDALGWGDRQLPGYDAQQALASNLLGLGSSWSGLIAAEDAASAEFLWHHPLVDPSRVAAVGFSMGAVRAWQLHALSSRVRATAAVCSFGTVAGQMVPGGNRVRGQSAFSMTHPGLARLLDYPDVAALGAPKPLLMIHGTEDRLFPVADVGRAYEKTASVYRAAGRSGDFVAEFRAGGHTFPESDQDRVWTWLDNVVPRRV